METLRSRALVPKTLFPAQQAISLSINRVQGIEPINYGGRLDLPNSAVFTRSPSHSWLHSDHEKHLLDLCSSNKSMFTTKSRWDERVWMNVALCKRTTNLRLISLKPNSPVITTTKGPWDEQARMNVALCEELLILGESLQGHEEHA